MVERVINTMVESEFLRACNEIAKWVKEGHTLLTKDLITDPQPYDGEDLSNLCREVARLISSIKRDYNKGLGQMYNGVLIDEEVSLRGGRIYPYRCQYRMSEENVLQLVTRDGVGEEIKNKLGSKMGDIVIQLANKIGGSDLSSPYITKQVKVNPIQVFDFKYKSYREMDGLKQEGEVLTINLIQVNYDNRHTFYQEGVGEDSKSLNNYNIIKELYKVYKNDIDKAEQEIKQETLDRIDYLKQLHQEVIDGFGKYLIVANIQE